jgi:Fe(3+) dicitrate transport protein
MKLSLYIIFLFCPFLSFAQVKNDSTRYNQLKEIIIQSWQKRDITRIGDENPFLSLGKKNEVIQLSGINTNITLKTGRQVFAKIPGVFIYDMDGSGNQVNIASRGLDPHRSWEYNIRQNGIILNSDMYGYPASHYSAPMENIERIEIVRGASGIQFGAQFGGMINYVTKQPDSTRPIVFEIINTVASYNTISSYNSLSGTKGKWSYQTYYYKRHSDGYRNNSTSDAEAYFGQLKYRLSKNNTIKLEIGKSKYLYRLPGPLTDSMFNFNPRSSTRKRNYYSPDIYVPSLSFDFKLGEESYLTIIASGIFGSRNSVLFDAFANIADTMERTTGLYKNRQVDIDIFNSRNLDFQYTTKFRIGRFENNLKAGVLYTNNNLHRKQLGIGSTGDDYNLDVENKIFRRDLNLKTQNLAAFITNIMPISKKLTLIPGIRYENGVSKMEGSISYYDTNKIPKSIKRNFILAGINADYKINEENRIYSSFSQGFRPVLFKDIIPSSVLERVADNLKDARGYNMELGIRGKISSNFQYDFSVFSLLYKNRMGLISLDDANGNAYLLRSNIGDSRTNGIELFAQYKFPLAVDLLMGVFTSSSVMNGEYISGEIWNGSKNTSIVGNQIESIPHVISRNGIEFLYKNFTTTILYSYTSKSYSDPLNTVEPTINGSRGLVPEYGLIDINTTFRAKQFYLIKFGINNLLNKSYFTKRPTMYPGPGIWPSDGRNYYISISLKI